jgi:CspA family cold shock protein
MEQRRRRQATAVAVGIVKSFDDGSGNGWIAREGDTDVFVNREAIRGDGPPSLRVGARVRIAVMDGPNGPRATAVRPL